MLEKEKFTKENCGSLLGTYMQKENISVEEVSKAIGCRYSTTKRILAGATYPTEEFIKQVGILIHLGFERYSKLSDTEKESISEAIGAVGGGVLGFGAISAAVSASGTVAGLSAAGITSGLAAIGAGGMLGGILTLVAFPLAAGAAGYGIVKGLKYYFTEAELASEEIDLKWEKNNSLVASFQK